MIDNFSNHQLNNRRVGQLILAETLLFTRKPDWKVCTARAISCAHRNVHGFQPWARSWQ